MLNPFTNSASKAVGPLVISLLLVGCTTSNWVKPGATQQDFATDTYDCEKDMRQSSYFGTGLIGALNADGFQSRCMVAHGWSLQTAGSAPAPVAANYPAQVAAQSTDAPPPPNKEQIRAEALDMVKAGDCNTAVLLAGSTSNYATIHEIAELCSKQRNR